MKHLIIVILMSACTQSAKQPEETKTRANTDSLPVAAQTAVTGDAILLDKASWLQGEWHLVSGGSHQVENWQKHKDSSMRGYAFMLKGKDTISSESMQIVQRGEQLIFISTVKGQNHNRPIEFVAVNGDKSELRFVNPSHDFPQVISYKQVSDVFMVASISGKQNGKLKTKEYPMIRKVQKPL